MTVTEGSSGQGEKQLSSLIGQATAGLTIAAAIIYGAGALTIALRLYFTHLNWEAVLGQLPHDLIITTGFGQIILPAILIGLLGSVFLSFSICEQGHSRFMAGIQQRLQRYLLEKPGFVHFLKWLFLSVILGAAQAAVSIPYYVFHSERYFRPGVVIPVRAGLLVAAGLCALAVGVALILMPAPLEGTVLSASVSPEKEWRKPSQLRPAEWKAWVAILVGFAAIPGIATFSAVTLFPATRVCSTSFNNGQLAGNLIATSGGWAYMIEYRDNDNNYSHDYIAVIPQSELRLQTVGIYGNCNTLSPSPIPSPSADPTQPGS